VQSVSAHEADQRCRKIRRALETLTQRITIVPAVAMGARRAVEACSRFSLSGRSFCDSPWIKSERPVTVVRLSDQSYATPPDR